MRKLKVEFPFHFNLRIHGLDDFKKKYDVDEVYYTDEVSSIINYSHYCD